MMMSQTEGRDFLSLVETFAEQTLRLRRFDPAAFLPLLTSMNLSIDYLYRSYVGKNVLNFFRQDHGYKEGTYLKTWNGREDNLHLVEVLAELDPESLTYRDDVYKALLQRYPA